METQDGKEEVDRQYNLDQFLEDEEEDGDVVFSDEEDEDAEEIPKLDITWKDREAYEIVQSPPSGKKNEEESVGSKQERIYFEIKDLRKSWQLKKEVLEEESIQSDGAAGNENYAVLSKHSQDTVELEPEIDVLGKDSAYSKKALDALHQGEQIKLDRVTPCNQCLIHPALFSKLYKESKSIEKLFEKKGKREITQAALHFLVDHPDSSLWAQIVQFIVIFLIILSTVHVVLSSVQSFENWKGWQIIEEIVSILFTIELFLRYIASKSKMRFCKSIMNWIDLIAVVPFYLSLAYDEGSENTGNFRVIRTIRLIRVLRLFKLGRYIEVLSVFSEALTVSSEPLILFVLFILMLSIFSGTVMTAVEGGDKSSFYSIPIGIYWALTTLTTTGFGDLVPSQDLGKFIANITMIVGILIFSLPLAVIGANFQTAYSEFKALKSRKKNKKKLKNTELKKLIHYIVKDHNELALSLTKLLTILQKESILGSKKSASKIRFMNKKQQIVDNTLQSLSVHFDSNLKKIRGSVWGVLENVQKVTELIHLVSEEWIDEPNEIEPILKQPSLSSSPFRKVSNSLANLFHQK
jgi:voltage-gated potassium channel